ncbi:unnamed protein product [Dibothriocephalus latus]|uniref:Uncharacterized protein n=1 Tax=Dibothriocephalus latus TaxID=60516 RepID=A0A3P7N177_DIBLA|nr:unnamed protein product [Dibothriocephalus latus]
MAPRPGGGDGGERVTHGSIAGSINGDCSGEQTPPEKEVLTSAKPNSRPSSNLRSSVYRPDHDSSILIHRHPDKGFTELVLRSPGTPVQNSFTVKLIYASQPCVSRVLSGIKTTISTPEGPNLKGFIEKDEI